MSDNERALLAITARLWNLWCLLDARHPSDDEEMMRDVHSIQNRIMARVAKRADPDFFT